MHANNVGCCDLLGIKVIQHNIIRVGVNCVHTIRVGVACINIIKKGGSCEHHYNGHGLEQLPSLTLINYAKKDGKHITNKI